MYVVTGIIEEPATCTCTSAPTGEAPVFFPEHLYSPTTRGAQNPGCQVASVTKFCMVATNVCGFWLRNLLHFALLAPRIFKVLEICAPLYYTVSHSARNNSIQQSHFCEANISSASQESIYSSWNPRIPCLQAPTTSPSHEPNKPNPCPPLLLF